MEVMATAIKGLRIKGMKKFFPKLENPKFSPIAIHPAPTRAPVKLCVVEIGTPKFAVTKTVSPAPRITEARKAGFAITESGTNPLPLKVFTSFSAKKKAMIEPARVVAVAQARALR
jgi:hypothetical protein